MYLREKLKIAQSVVMSRGVKSQNRKGPSYYTRNPDAPIPENSAAFYLGLKHYDSKFESYYENDYQNSGITLPLSRYIGPGNSANLGEPKTGADVAAKRHDLRYAHAAYRFSNKRVTQAQYNKLIDKADSQFQSENVLYSPHGIIGKGGIGLKQLLETATGQLYPGNNPHKSQFETAPEPHDFVALKEAPAAPAPQATTKFKSPWSKARSKAVVEKKPMGGHPDGPDNKKIKTGHEAEPEGIATATAPGAAATDVEMAVNTGTGKEMASGGASSDGQMVHYIEKPLTIFSRRENIYKKSHKFMTFGLADVMISPTPAIDGTTYLTSYLAEIPWHIPALYMNPSEFGLLQPGSHCTEVSIEVYYRGSTIQFETAGSGSGLATLNQINDIAVAHGLNRTGWGSNVSYTGFSATQPMIPSGVAKPKYGPIPGNYRGMVADYYGADNNDVNFTDDIPKHQTGRQTFLYNYWAMSLRGGPSVAPAALQFGGWPALVEKTEQMDGKTVVNQCVAQSTYKPKLGPLTAPLQMQNHASPFPIAGTSIQVEVGGNLVNTRTATIGTQAASATSTTNNTSETTNVITNNAVPVFGMYAPIEKCQMGRTGFWGESLPHIQPSIHIGVQPVPALSTPALLAEESAFNQWTDTRAYWEVIATMKTTEHNPTAFPFATQGNIPAGDVVMWNPPAQRPAAILQPANDAATFAGLYPNSAASF